MKKLRIAEKTSAISFGLAIVMFMILVATDQLSAKSDGGFSFRQWLLFGVSMICVFVTIIARFIVNELRNMPSSTEEFPQRVEPVAFPDKYLEASRRYLEQQHKDKIESESQK